ncbi:MAG: tRNA (adenosine(37)-N6)-threonylcarbamoyltransferase complex ATPase subunit type 1 TsaE [Patescibacteria group bacterium]
MITKDREATIESGHQFAKTLKGGEVIGLIGELGSGKTTFVKGLAEGLHINETITSPTFVILKVYPSKIERKKIEFVHIDAYRVETIDDIRSVGIEDFLGRDDTIIVVEWAEKIKEVLSKKTKYIHFKYKDPDSREITMSKR